MRLSPRTVQEIDSPMGATYALLAGRSGERALLDLAQAAPSYPPAPEMVEHVAKVAHEPNGAAYVPSPGLPRLRDAFAADLSRGYQSPVGADQMVVTAGCNQAFCLVAQALTEPGDEVIEVLPYYFNYDMWLRMNGVVPRYLEPGPDLVPDPEAAEALITPRTRAIVLVTPGNPSGVTIPPDVLADLRGGEAARYRADQDAKPLQLVHGLVDVAHTALQLRVVRMRHAQELDALITQLPHRVHNVVGRQRNMLHARSAIEIEILLDLRLLLPSAGSLIGNFT